MRYVAAHPHKFLPETGLYTRGIVRAVSERHLKIEGHSITPTGQLQHFEEILTNSRFSVPKSA